jgi:hypothetical protein
MNPQPKLSILLFSDANFLAVNILENLLSKNCVVNIITKDVTGWGKMTVHLAANKNFSIIDRKDIGNNPCDYAIFCGGFINTGSAYKDFFDFSSLNNINNAKILSLFPLEAFDRSQIDKIHPSATNALLFLGDLLGPRINLDSDLITPRLITEILWDRKLTMAVGQELFPIFVADAVKIIVKWLFSFGPYGKVVLLLGSRTSGDTFWEYNKKYFSDLGLKYDTKIPARVVPRNIETEIVDSNLNYSLGETYDWLKGNWTKQLKPPPKKKEVVTRVVGKRQWKFKKYKLLAWTLFLLLALPFITLLMSLFISLVAYKSFISGHDGVAQNSFLLARTASLISEKGSKVLSYIPGLGLIYKETEFAAVVSQQTNSIGTHLIPVVRGSIQLLENVLGDKVYDSVSPSRNIESEVELIYNDIVATRGVINAASEKNIILAKKILSKIDIERFITLTSEGRTLADSLPALLGQDASKTYLILFENNMELRPTGGFIGSFGLVTFDKGRLSDLTVNDVYSADGQLNGHVEPPLPIKNYLGEANWWLRDSNWDPDFPTSAKRAEWFLDKELSKEVDGVIAIDLFPIKEILKSTGQIFLSDYNMGITSENLYEKTQSEVENNFFPGTHKKASFLTALSRNLLTEVTKLGMNQKLDILKTFYSSLNGRHVQIYLHDNISQDAFSVLGWDGGVTAPTCGVGCYADMAGIVEANVGMNKVNYFIQRSIDLEVTLSPDKIDHKLTLILKDTANPALGPSGRYKNYLRLLLPSDAFISSIVSYNGDVQESLIPELTNAKGHKEVGVLVELLPGNTKNIEFSWTSGAGGISSYTDYGLYFRKQAGTDADPININIIGAGLQLNPDPRLALTRDGTYRYNTTLARDLFLRLSR